MERGAGTPLVDRRTLAPKDFVTSAAVFFPLLIVFGGSVFIVPFYFEWLRKADADMVGRVLMVQPIATIAVSTLAGFFLADTSRRLLCLAGVVLMAAGAALLALADRDALVAVPMAALVLMGAGAGLYYPTLIQLGMANVPGDLAPSASSLQATVRVLAQLIGVVLFETIFSQIFPTALHVDLAAAAEGPTLVAMQAAFHAVFWCATVIALAALVPAMMLGRPPGSPELADALEEAGEKA